MQGINITDSKEREEILKKRIRTEKQMLFTEAVRFVLNLYLEIDYRSKKENATVTQEQAEVVLQQFLTDTTELSSEIVSELQREYGDYLVNTALEDNELLELLAGRRGTFRLDIKNIIIGRALVYADVQVSGVNQPGSQPVKRAGILP